MKRWPFKMALLGYGLVFGAAALGDSGEVGGVQYFKDPEIDFWKGEVAQDKSKAVVVVPTGKGNPKNGVAPTSKSSFAWGKYLNPSNDEFFKEGDYTPPAPFMEIARNPTDQNIQNWFKYLETKNALLQTLQAKLSEYTMKRSVPGLVAMKGSPSSPEIDPDAVKRVQQRYEISRAPVADAKQFRLRLYFDSHCPHCEHMMGTVRELMQLGYWIELRQIDGDVSARSRIPFAVTSATPEELKRYQIESVPVLLVGNLKTQSFSKIQGYQPTTSVLAALQGTSRKVQ